MEAVVTELSYSVEEFAGKVNKMKQRNMRKHLEVRDITLIVVMVSQVYAVSKLIKLYTLKKKKKNYSHGDLTWPFGSTWICEAHERKRMKGQSL